MLGLGSMDTALALWLSLGAAVFCVVYGLLKWNDAGTPDMVVAGTPKGDGSPVAGKRIRESYQPKNGVEGEGQDDN